jgi:aryl-alcohol dehydrogenase-like predicted oxidoreductase
MMEYVTFGKTGLEVSRLSFGTGTHGFGGRSEQSSLGLDGLADLLCMAYDRGITFWDAADGYGTHAHIARALRGIPRDRVVIATKTLSRTSRGVTRDIERFLVELGTDVIDIVLMHFLTQPGWHRDYADAMQALSRAKEQGVVRAVGVSCHDLGALQEAAESDWVDVALVRINYAGVNMDADPVKVVPVIERLYAAGKGIYGMKVLGCGTLVDKARAAVEYVLQLGTVHAITIGTSSAQHLRQNLALMEKLAPRCPLRQSQ